MNTKQILISFFIIAFTLISCNPSTQFENSTEVSLESKKEAFSSSEQIQLTLVNDTHEDLYLNYCGPALLYKLEIKEEENWKNYSFGLCLDIYTPEFRPVLEPGTTKEITFDSLDAGEYRYNLTYKLSSGESDSHEISIEFSVQ